MPSHPLYALSNLNYLGSRKLYKNKSYVFEIEVLPKISLFRKNLFHIRLQVSLLAGFDIFNVFSSLSLIYHLHLMLHYLVFKVQPEYVFFCISWWIYSPDASIRPKLVEMRRIELLTPCLQGRCSPSWATPPNLSWYFVINSLPYTRTACAVSSSSELKFKLFSISLIGS